MQARPAAPLGFKSEDDVACRTVRQQTETARQTSGEAVLTTGRRRESLHALELTQPEAADFFANVVVSYVGDSAIKRWLLGLLGASDILRDPAGAATSRPVFELR